MSHVGHDHGARRKAWSVLTCRLVEGVSSQSERDAALVAGEAAAMEELALRADALQRVDPLVTEVTLLAVRHGLGGSRRRLGGSCRCGTELRGRRRLRRLRGERSTGIKGHTCPMNGIKSLLKFRRRRLTLSSSPILVPRFSDASFSCRGEREKRLDIT